MAPPEFLKAALASARRQAEQEEEERAARIAAKKKNRDTGVPERQEKVGDGGDPRQDGGADQGGSSRARDSPTSVKRPRESAAEGEMVKKPRQKSKKDGSAEPGQKEHPLVTAVGRAEPYPCMSVWDPSCASTSEHVRQIESLCYTEVDRKHWDAASDRDVAEAGLRHACRTVGAYCMLLERAARRERMEEEVSGLRRKLAVVGAEKEALEQDKLKAAELVSEFEGKLKRSESRVEAEEKQSGLLRTELEKEKERAEEAEARRSELEKKVADLEGRLAETKRVREDVVHAAAEESFGNVLEQLQTAYPDFEYESEIISVMHYVEHGRIVYWDDKENREVVVLDPSEPGN